MASAVIHLAIAGW